MLINRGNSAMLPIVAMFAQRAMKSRNSRVTVYAMVGGGSVNKHSSKCTIVTNKRPQWIDIVEDRYELNDKVAMYSEIFRLYHTDGQHLL